MLKRYQYFTIGPSTEELANFIDSIATDEIIENRSILHLGETFSIEYFVSGLMSIDNNNIEPQTSILSIKIEQEVDYVISIWFQFDEVSSVLFELLYNRIIRVVTLVKKRDDIVVHNMLGEISTYEGILDSTPGPIPLESNLISDTLKINDTDPTGEPWDKIEDEFDRKIVQLFLSSKGKLTDQEIARRIKNETGIDRTPKTISNRLNALRDDFPELNLYRK